MKWQVKIISADSDDAEGEMNALGADGWELVNAALETHPKAVGAQVYGSGAKSTPIYNGTYTRITAIFKRAI
jgi:hypothetical protein